MDDLGDGGQVSGDGAREERVSGKRAGERGRKGLRDRAKASQVSRVE
jgi:hypothetical protein